MQSVPKHGLASLNIKNKDQLIYRIEIVPALFVFSGCLHGTCAPNDDGSGGLKPWCQPLFTFYYCTKKLDIFMKNKFHNCKTV